MHRGVEIPACYAAAWELVRGLEARDFSDESLCMLFHVHLMHATLVDSSRSVAVAYPAWLMTEARDAWKRSVRDDTTTSRSHRDLARVFGELGIRHVVERVTDDGYFSMDIYLPDYDVAVEYDGPAHYYNDPSHYYMNGGDSTTRTAKTKLRDVILAERCAKVVTVPFFEFDSIKDSPEKARRYVKEKLATEAGIDVASRK